MEIPPLVLLKYPLLVAEQPGGDPSHCQILLSASYFEKLKLDVINPAREEPSPFMGRDESAVPCLGQGPGCERKKGHPMPNRYQVLVA